MPGRWAATVELMKNRAEKAEAERDRLREAAQSLVDAIGRLQDFGEDTRIGEAITKAEAAITPPTSKESK